MNLLIEKESERIAGFYAIGLCDPASLDGCENWPFSHYADAVFGVLGRLAVATAYQEQGLGTLLVQHAVTLMQEQWPVPIILVDPKTEQLCTFYEQFGFQRLGSSLQMALLLPKKKIL